MRVIYFWSGFGVILFILALIFGLYLIDRWTK